MTDEVYRAYLEGCAVAGLIPNTQDEEAFQEIVSLRIRCPICQLPSQGRYIFEFAYDGWFGPLVLVVYLRCVECLEGEGYRRRVSTSFARTIESAQDGWREYTRCLADHTVLCQWARQMATITRPRPFKGQS